MKKLLLTSLVAVFAVSGAQAADYFVGGAAALAFDDTHENVVAVSPEFGWHHNDKWDFGLNADFGYMRDVEDTFNYGVGMFARYKVAEFGGFKVMLKGTVGADFETISSEDTKRDGETLTTFSASVIPMVTYDISEEFTLYANLNFLGVRAGYTLENETLNEPDGWGVGAIADSANVANTSDFKIGFLYNF